MIRAALIVAAMILIGASASELVMARRAERFGSVVFDRTDSVLLPLPSMGRGGDHLLQIAVNLVSKMSGRKMTPAETKTLQSVVAEIDREVAAGHAGDRLRNVRP